MTPEAVRWYKAAGAQDYGSASCIIDCWAYDMPRDLNGMQYHMGWDYCAAQLEQLGCIGDAVEIYRLHSYEGQFPKGLSCLLCLSCFI